ncbi:MAG: hypothetical protein MZW92_49275 [Comamonadaceae bacterium]|nr:hypothetical protein [Comamonadaceae bacterium]
MVGKAKSSRGDFTASEDDNVLVQGVSHGQGRARLLRLRLLRREQQEAQGGADRGGKAGKPAVSPPRRRSRTAPTSRCPARSSSTSAPSRSTSRK